MENQNATTIFIGAADLDGQFGSGLRGIASDVDFGNNNRTDVAFVTRVHGDTPAKMAQFVANTAAREAGHTYGLYHVDNQGLNEVMRAGPLASDAVNAATNCTFLDRFFNEYFNDGGGRGPQNSYRVMMVAMGLISFPPGPPGDPVSMAARPAAARSTDARANSLLADVVRQRRQRAMVPPFRLGMLDSLGIEHS